MSVSKTGWVIAAAAAAAFVAGCAGQGHQENLGASCTGEAPVAPAAHGCKGESACKTAKVVKHHHRHHVEKTIKKDEEHVNKDDADNKENTDKDNSEAK